MGLTIHYYKKKDNVHIVRCYGTDSIVILPEKIDSLPVSSIEPYAFSSGKRSEDLDASIFHEDKSILTQEESVLLCEDNITEMHLPDSLESIGSYAFYRCFALKKLKLSDRVHSLGSGVFINCKLKEIELSFYHQEASCLKDIVNEVRHELYVKLYYHNLSDTIETAKLVFPEFYEEAVENTPARILETHFHGIGGNYRQCFYDRKIDYSKYDDLFPLAAAQEKPSVLTDMVLGRLKYPFRLSLQAKERYLDYLKMNLVSSASYLIQADAFDDFVFLSSLELWTDKMIQSAIDDALNYDKHEFVSFLMNEKNKLFKPQIKSFDL